jgi:hypothetical protein
MMVQAANGVPRPVGLATWRAVCSVALSYRVIAFAYCAYKRSAPRHSIVAPCLLAVSCAVAHCSTVLLRLSARFAGHDNAFCPHVLHSPR